MYEEMAQMISSLVCEETMKCKKLRRSVFWLLTCELLLSSYEPVIGYSRHVDIVFMLVFLIL